MRATVSALRRQARARPAYAGVGTHAPPPTHLQDDGVSPAGGRPEQFREAIRKEIEVWRKE